MEQHMQLSDQAFEVAFSKGALPPTQFSHEAHLRLAWIHIQNYGEAQAIENICTQILSYVKQLGAEDKFNKTLTVAAIKTVNHFIGRSQSQHFSDFIEEFPRLKYNFKDLLAAHYGIDIFNSELAKSTYLAPDLLPFT